MSNDENTTIDVGSWFATLAHNWWVIAGLIVLGIVVGAVVTMAQPKEYTATASVYIGQTTDANGNAMAGLNSNAKAATQLLASQVMLKEAADRAGMDISTSLPAQGDHRRDPVLDGQDIDLRGQHHRHQRDRHEEGARGGGGQRARQRAARAPRTGTNEKIAMLETQLAQGKKEYAAATARSVAAQQAIATIARGNASPAPRRHATSRALPRHRPGRRHRAGVISSSSNQKTELLLLTAKQVEQPRILHEAGIPDSPSGPTMSLNVAIGALAGLIIGIIVAFARRALADRRAGKTAAA